MENVLYLDVAVVYFLLGTLDLLSLPHSEVNHRYCPGLVTDILSGISKQLRVLQETVMAGLGPVKCWSRWMQGQGSSIVSFDHILNGFASGLQSLGDMGAQTVLR